MSGIPRVVIAAPSSGHGKTAIAVGLLAALRARGLRPGGFKIGPDHVDAAYLGFAAGGVGRNLDPQLVGASRIGSLFTHGGAGLDLAVIEGTMGLFDGLAGRTDTESTAQIAGLLRAPVVLVIDVATMGQSVAALVHGFRAYDELLWLGGVIFNRVASDRHERVLREAIDDLGVPVLGALRRGGLAGAALPSRLAGPVPVAHHNMEAIRSVRRLGEVVGGSVDIDRLLGIARSAPGLVAEAWSPEDAVGLLDTPSEERRPVVALAGGAADFSYAETRELLVAAGARVVEVDPLRAEALPPETAGLVIGGGLPEGYLEEMSANAGFLRSVGALAAVGAPIIAEGAGVSLLAREHDGRPMAGVLPTSTRVGDHLILGYRQATTRSVSPFLPMGTTLTGFKYHVGVATPRAGAAPAWLWPDGPAEGFVEGNVLASYLGLHWAGCPEIARRFVTATEPADGALRAAS